jgi:hypothetical protein
MNDRPKVTSGTLERMESFPSRYVAARHVDVWLPEGYGAGTRCNVIYMHDGQNLFDGSLNATGHAWNVDGTVSRLIAEGRLSETIVVGVWNNPGLRESEYFPQKFLPFIAEPRRGQFIEQALGGRPRSDDYLRFIVEEVKPAIDRTYRTHAEAAGTFVMGSSLGGLISVYAMCEYPRVFSGAAGLSTHWIGDRKAPLPLATFDYLRDHLADPGSHRLYMDRGTIELDALYGAHQSFIDEIVRERGYGAANAMSRTFEGTGHSERAWAERLEVPLLFLAGTR